MAEFSFRSVFAKLHVNHTQALRRNASSSLAPSSLGEKLGQADLMTCLLNSIPKARSKTRRGIFYKCQKWTFRIHSRFFLETPARDNQNSLPQIRGTQLQFSENIFSDDDLRSRIFRTFVLNFLLTCLS